MSAPFRLKLGARALELPRGAVEVGRGADCWLTLDDDQTSRHHARFHVTSEGVEIEDLDSRNGTRVNGDPLDARARVRLQDGDRVGIGRELLTFIGRLELDEVNDDLGQTIGPGDGAKVPSLIGALVEKSLGMGKVKEAERYALALTNQIAAAKVSVSHPTAQSAIGSLIALAEASDAGIWLDRVFRLHAAKGWVMQADVLARVRAALDRIPRVPGSGLADYEKTLRSLARDGQTVPPGLMTEISELVDAFGGG